MSFLLTTGIHDIWICSFVGTYVGSVVPDCGLLNTVGVGFPPGVTFPGSLLLGFDWLFVSLLTPDKVVVVNLK